MDSSDSQLSTSLLSENQDPFKICNQRDFLKLFFKAQKTVISFAIKKTFPFLETLRDHELITDAYYEELQTNLRKDVPVSNVVYNALRSLEEKFEPKHLDILFNEIHLKEYPELHKIQKSFRAAVVQNMAYVQDGREGDPLEGPSSTLSLEQGTSEDLQESLAFARRNTATPNGITLDANGVSDVSSDTEECRVIRVSLPRGERVAPESGQASNHRTQEPEKAEFCDEADQVNNGDARKTTCSPLSCAEQRVELSTSAIQSNRCFVSLTDIKKESPPFDSKEECDQENGIIEISSDDQNDVSGGEETPKASTSSRKRGLGKRRNNIKPLIRRKRGPRIRKDRNMNFKVPELPVTCGPVKGTLYKEKLKQGSASKCILRENGRDWLTLREFEIEGGKDKCKNWRLSVRCGGWTLKELIEKNYLQNPPRTKRKTVTQEPSESQFDPWPENHNVCDVCGGSGTLYCCDSCPRSFHQECHIQRINRKRDPWFCIFCSIKRIQSNPSQNQYYQESEVLLRPMDYINKLKCQFILLKMYSDAKSSFFIQEPYHSKELLPQDPGTMCLNKVKENLRWKKYLLVQEFVRDMHLIFENHKEYYKDRNIITLAYQLEKEFENHFRDIFRIHCKEKSKN